FWMDQSYFHYAAGLRMTNRRFEALFGGPARAPDGRLEQRHMDIAASIQKVTEECVLRMARHAHAVTGQPNLVMAGGVALNCVANGRLLREGPFQQVWIQPAAGDAGGALGAALHVWHQLLERPRPLDGQDRQRASYLGPSYQTHEIRAALDAHDAVYEPLADESTLLDRVAALLDEGKIVGWFQGRAEFGPRALGARSILADPRRTDTQASLNLKIKFREGFRPFAPCVLKEHVSAWFETRPNEESPYMLMVAPIAAGKRVPLSADDARTLREDPDLIRRVNVPRSVVPAVTHVDYSARIQTVDARHGRLQRLMQRFFERTGCPIVVNTSFNLSWEPIVLTPAQAYATFMHSEMDALVLEDVLLLKTAQPANSTVPMPAKAAAGSSGLSWWRRLTKGEGSAVDPALVLAHGPDDSDRTIRQFALIGAALLAGLAAWNGWSAGATSSVLRTVAMAAVLALLGTVWPAAVRPAYRLALIITAPVGAVVSKLVLAAIYYGCFTPLGLFFRVVGRDELRLARPAHAETYWRATRGPRAARDYLRQS
ncbi:MAG: carbamoyltransferase C-terminal domain-containing protein, partial [Vicinamibacterales bacterium]